MITHDVPPQLAKQTRLGAHEPMLETPLKVRVSLCYRSKRWFLMWALVSNKWLWSCLPVVGHAHCFGAETVADRQRTCSV